MAIHSHTHPQPPNVMSLTYQPFAEVPEIQALSHELHMNVSDNERTLSALAGASLFVLGLARSDWSKWVLLGLGAALVGRGATGQCLGYRALNMDKRHAA